MSAKKLLQLLEEQSLLSDSAMADIKRQIAEKKKVSAATIAKALVEKGLLTKFQATQLVGEATADSDSGVQLDEKQDGDEVVMLEDAGGGPVAGLTPVEDAGSALTPVSPPPAPAAEGELEPLDGLDSLDPMGGGGLEPLGGGGLDPIDGSASTSQKPVIPGKKKKSKPKKDHQNWGGKLMIGGGGLLLFLILGGALLVYNLGRDPAIKIFEHAEEAYAGENWAEALKHYQNLIDQYPRDDNVDNAQVRIVLCRIRIVLSDPQKAYDMAMELLPTIETLEAFPPARDELTTILPKIVQGYIRDAKRAADMDEKEQILGKAKQALKDLVNNPKYIPASKRPAIADDLKRIDEDIVLITREISRERELVKAIGQIQAEIAAGETNKAYDVYNALVREYPSLRENEALRAEVRKITDAEQRRVQVSSDEIAASTDVHKAASQYKVVLATRSGGNIQRLENQPIALLAGGSVYALDAGSGRVLWRRYVGYGKQHHPIPISNTPGADIIVSDGQRNEVVRVKAASGDLVWRVGIGEAFESPAVAGDSVFVTTVSGKILRLDAATGTSSQQVTVPQPLQVSAGVAQTHPYLLQPGTHSNLYAISTETLECSEVEYLGHKAGTITVPPLVIQDHILIAENHAPGKSRLHIRKITPDSGGRLFSRTQDPILLEGQVVVPMILYGRRPLLVTDLGQINVFNVDFRAETETVKHAATPNAVRAEPMMSFPVVEGQTLVVADDKLVKYDLQITRKLIRQDRVTNSKEAFIAPPMLLGDILVVTRRLGGSTGATVSAFQVDNPRKDLWTTHLSVPVSRASMSGRKLDVVTAAASRFEVDRAVLDAGYASDPKANAAVAGSLSFTDPVVLNNGTVAFFNPADNARVLIQQPGSGTGSLRVVTLKLNGSKATCTPRPFKDGLLTPLENGSVALLNTTDGDNIVLPFQPSLSPGEDVKWCRPAIVAEEFVIIDDRQNVYRVGIKDQPQPFLSELGAAKLDVNIDSELATAGDTVYGVVKNSGGDVVLAINAADLSVAKEFPLEGRVKWGPVQVDDLVFCLSDAEGLVCYAAGGEQVWEKPAKFEGHPAGLPLRDGEDFIFALLDGTVVRVAGSDGALLGKSAVGEPLGAGPVAYNGLLLLPGHDGALHVMRPPSAVATPPGEATPPSAASSADAAATPVTVGSEG